MKTHFQVLIIGLFIFVSADGKQLPGDADGYQHSFVRDLYNQSKTHVMQDNHQPEYYGYEPSCPNAEDIAPCWCKYHSDHNTMDLDCSAVESEDQLKQIFTADFPFKTFIEFHMYENINLKVLESSVFNGVSFERIKIVYGNFDVIDNMALDSSYNTADYISFYSNMITSFPFDELSQFTKLTHLDISSNSLSLIPADAFNGLTTLEYLDISHNDITSFPSFNGLTTLEYLDIYLNDITSFPFDELSQFTKLTHLDISSNSLSMIPADAFNGLTTLEYLDIGRNDANIVGTFENLPSLKEIHLFGSNLTNVPNKFINTGSSNLQYIDLGNNNIITVEPGAFDIVEDLFVYIDYNSLSTLDEATWRPLLEGGGRMLEATHNPLSCGCDIAWLFQNTDNLLDQLHATCTDGEDIHDLDPSKFDDC